MRTWYALLLLVASTAPLSADLKIGQKTILRSESYEEVSYSQGKNRRVDTVERGYSMIQKDGAMYFVDRNRKQFVEPGGPGILAVLASWIARPIREHASGKTVNVYYELTDTGERRQQFGYTAHHLIVRERLIAESGACEPSQETTREGWYIPGDQMKMQTPRYTNYLAFNGVRCVDHVVRHGASFTSEFPLLETTTKIFPGQSSGSNWTMTRQITALSTQALDQTVFEIPSDFKKVDEIPGYMPSLPWTDRLAREWGQLVRAAESWTD